MNDDRPSLAPFIFAILVVLLLGGGATMFLYQRSARAEAMAMAARAEAEAMHARAEILRARAEQEAALLRADLTDARGREDSSSPSRRVAGQEADDARGNAPAPTGDRAEAREPEPSVGMTLAELEAECARLQNQLAEIQRQIDRMRGAARDARARAESGHPAP